MGSQTTYVWHRASMAMVMRLLPLLVALLSIGCASVAEEATGSSGEALSELTISACETPILKTKAGAPGSAITTISGCVVGRAGESGKDVIGRAATTLGDTARIGRVKAPSGTAIFSAFTPGPATGTLATGIVQEVDVTLDMFGSPSSKLRVTRKLGADGGYSLKITNLTPFTARIAFIPVTAINAGDLTLDVQMKPETNGLTVNGNGNVQLQLMQDEAAAGSEIVRDLFNWLTTELAL